jgi:acyl-CoA hydrolase
MTQEERIYSLEEEVKKLKEQMRIVMGYASGAAQTLSNRIANLCANYTR